MELVRFTSRGGFSVRSIFTFVLSVVITALLWGIVSSTAIQAQSPEAGVDDTANWQGGGTTLLYDKHGYTKATELKDSSGTIPADATIYQSAIQNGTSSSVSQKVFIIYFSSGVDPPTATSAKYVEFDYKSGTISNPQDMRDIKVTAQDPNGNSGSSCSVSGIGYLVCPVSEFLAGAMDWVFALLVNLIEVQPTVLGDPNNSMYVAWNIMRSIANIAFVIAFLIIIYSQLTNVAVSNYGLKKLIPRLIIAAILVNLSYYIAALAIDISNILGYSVQEVFNRIREDTFHLTNDNVGGFNESSWSIVTAIALGSVGGVIGGTFFIASGSYYLLLPILLGALLTVMFVVIVLAARQAIIVILVIIAPLAFVANLLPNTEKWFDKWKDLFFTMLIFFPAFSLVFGGSQLAGQIIIQNAGDDFVMLIFGMAVQIAPLVITPLLLKLSGSLLGRIAQIANNPRKGLVDRNRNWAQSRAEHAKQRNIARGGRANLGAALVRRADFQKRRLSDNTDLWKQKANNRYHATDGYEKTHTESFEAEQTKQIIEDGHKRHIQDKINTPTSRLHLQNTQLEAGRRVLGQTVKLTEATTKEYDAGFIPAGSSPELQASIRQMQSATQETSIQDMRASKAAGQIQRDFSEVLKRTPELRRRAGGIQPLGPDSVLAAAVSAVRRADAEDIKHIQEASDLAPGDLAGTAREMEAAIRAGNDIRARAYQNMLVTAGGAGMNKFRETMISIGSDVPDKVSELMRDNMLTNHGGLKAKSNDLIEWAARGGVLETHTTNPASWARLSDKDFMLQHPTSQGYALDTNPFDKERAERILAADAVEGNVLNETIKARLRSIT